MKRFAAFILAAGMLLCLGLRGRQRNIVALRAMGAQGAMPRRPSLIRLKT